MKRRLVLLVHGLGGSGEGTWARFPELIRNDSELGPSFDVCFYEYPTALSRLPLGEKMPKIQDLARGLATEIRNRYAEYSEVALICHSLGGLVARQYVLETIKSQKPFPVSRLMLIASPNAGSQLAAIGKLFSWNHAQLEQLQTHSEFLESFNDDWRELDIEERIVVRYVVAGLDKVVTRESARNHAKGSEIEFVIDKGHIDVVKPDDANALSFLIVKRFLLESNEAEPGRNEPPTGDLSAKSGYDDLTYQPKSVPPGLGPQENVPATAHLKPGVYEQLRAALAEWHSLKNLGRGRQILAALPFRDRFGEGFPPTIEDLIDELIAVCEAEPRGFGALLDDLLDHEHDAYPSQGEELTIRLCNALDGFREQEVPWAQVLHLKQALTAVGVEDSVAQYLYREAVPAFSGPIRNCRPGTYFVDALDLLAGKAVGRFIVYVLRGLASREVAPTEVIEMLRTIDSKNNLDLDALRAEAQAPELPTPETSLPAVLRIKIAPDVDLDFGKPDFYLFTAWICEGDDEIRLVEDRKFSANQDQEDLVGELCATVRTLFPDARDHLKNPAARIQLELFLPIMLLHRPVERWNVRVGGKDKRLGTHCPIILRSYERHYLRSYRETWPNWFERCDALPEAPSVASGDHIFWAETAADFHGESHVEQPLLATPLSLGGPDCQRCEELLSAGFPVALWMRREPVDSEAVRAMLQAIVCDGPFAGLPHRLWEKRRRVPSWEEVALLFDDFEHCPSDAPSVAASKNRSIRRPPPWLTNPGGMHR